MSFEKLNLSQSLLTVLRDSGYVTPTPIQAEAIPVVLKGKDVMAAAQTGTGKTAGFTLPILDLLTRTSKPREKGNYARVLILAPTRELAIQVAQSVKHYSRDLPIKSDVVYGGVKINPQMQRLRGGVDILVATPGRLLDLAGQNAIKLGAIETFVLDEADRMLDMGFIHDIRKVIDRLPTKRQNLMFSATFSKPIRTLAKTIMANPVEITVNPPNSASTQVKQVIHPVDKKEKPSLLIHLLKAHKWRQVLVFSRTKHGANKLVKQLNQANITASAIHGNKSQGARVRALAEFKSGDITVLVATDIASRGLDIDQLPQVINVDLPQVAEDYVHRIGRTGRAGAKGAAISLVSADEIEILQEIEKLLGKTIEREYIDEFEPNHSLPESKLTQKKKSRPKKPKAKKGAPPTSQKAKAHQPQKNKANTAKKSSAGKGKGNSTNFAEIKKRSVK